MTAVPKGQERFGYWARLLSLCDAEPQESARTYQKLEEASKTDCQAAWPTGYLGRPSGRKVIHSHTTKEGLLDLGQREGQAGLRKAFGA